MLQYVKAKDDYLRNFRQHYPRHPGPLFAQIADRILEMKFNTMVNDYATDIQILLNTARFKTPEEPVSSSRVPRTSSSGDCLAESIHYGLPLEARNTDYEET